MKLIPILLIMIYAGNINAQICFDSIKAVAPNARYIDHGDGTVSDKVTGLMWKKCGEGVSSIDCSGFWPWADWQRALEIPAEVNGQGGFAGYSDWRLPNIKELASLVEERCREPAINTTMFPNSPHNSAVWSSSPVYGVYSEVWSVEFRNGMVERRDSDSNSSHVRLVRTE